MQVLIPMIVAGGFFSLSGRAMRNCGDTVRTTLIAFSILIALFTFALLSL